MRVSTAMRSHLHDRSRARLFHVLMRMREFGVVLALVGDNAFATAVTSRLNAHNPADNALHVVSVSKLDFVRGDDGQGRLIVQFDRPGAHSNLRTQGQSVLMDVGNARLPDELRRTQDVTDLATPVQRIDARTSGDGMLLELSTHVPFELLSYQSGNEYVVEIIPHKDVPAILAATPDATRRVVPQTAVRGYSGEPVTFNFQDVPVRTVLQLIAEESGFNLVAADTVQGNITLRLVNVPWDQALDIVLRAKGLDKRRDGQVIWVGPQSELARLEQDKQDARIAIENREDLTTDYLQINYHSASAILKSLTDVSGIGGSSGPRDSGFLSPRGRVVVDERTNMLMISDIPKKVAQMRELVEHIDRPVEQVLIEGRIVIAADTFARDLGASFGIGSTRNDGGNVATVGSGIDANANAIRGLNFSGASTTHTNSMAAIAYTLLGSNFNLELELAAMQEEGRGEILSHPRIVTSNQREGVIKQGQQVGYVTYTTSGSTGIQSPTVQFKDVVLELKVTPMITGDNRVSMAINVKKDSVSAWKVVENYGSVPLIDTREITTAVLVEDGQTVVIGGIYEFTDQSSVAKVPFLGDIPFLGNLFKKRGKKRDKAELLIFVTPKVLRMAQAADDQG